MTAGLSLAVRVSGVWHSLADRMARFRADTVLSRGLDQLGQQTAQTLAAATPRKTGKAAAGWSSRRTGANQVTISNSQSYVRYLVTGTAPHIITPRGRYLAFLVGGRRVFARQVHHPGTKPNPRLRQIVEGLPAEGRMTLQEVGQDIIRELRG